MYLQNPRNGAALDLPPANSSRTWVLAATPRTGSSWLCRLLTDTALVGVPLEYFNPRDMRDWEARTSPRLWRRWQHGAMRGPTARLVGVAGWSDARLSEYVARVRHHRTSATGWFGVKLHYHHHRRFFGTPRRLAHFLNPTAWVWLRRRDRVAQAVSWALALQTQAWRRAASPKRPALYSEALITYLIERIEAHERAWESVFRALNVAPLCLSYEDVQAAPERAVGTILAHLGITSVGHSRVAEPAASASSLRSLRWRERYRARLERRAPAER